MRTCDQQCGRPATGYWIDPIPGGWGGAYCQECGTGLRFQKVDSYEQKEQSMDNDHDRQVLARAWREEWEALDPVDQDAVAADFAKTDGADRRDYHFHIGTGNLARYAASLRAARR